MLPSSTTLAFCLACYAFAIANLALALSCLARAIGSKRSEPEPAPITAYLSSEAIERAQDNARTFAEVEQLGRVVDQVVEELGEATEVLERLGPYVGPIEGWFRLTTPSLRTILNDHADGLDRHEERILALADVLGGAVCEAVKRIKALEDRSEVARRERDALDLRLGGLELSAEELAEIEPDPLERPFVGQHVLFVDDRGATWPAVVVFSHMDTDLFPVDLFVFKPHSGFAERIERGGAGDKLSWRHINGE
jgi:hypothetical protein